MNAAEALAQYEAVRHRLPRACGKGACRKVTDLSDLAGMFDTFLLDAFGVLNVGEAAIPGAPERVADLQAAGKRVMVLTNTASVPQSALVAKYRRMGYAFAPQDVISSRQILLAQLGMIPRARWGLMLPEGAGVADLGNRTLIPLGDEEAAYAGAEGFLLLGSGGWTEPRQSRLEAALRSRPRPVWVGNPDIVAPREAGFSIEPGHYAHRLADLTGIAPRFFGKPFPGIFEHALARLEPEPDLSRTVMVGDSLHTDILGAQAAGIASALVSGYGFFRDGSPESAIARTGIVPDFLLATT